jgi:hypothetical protein
LHKADATNAITVPQRKEYSQFIVCGEVGFWVMVIEDEGKGREMRQHVRDRSPICAKEGKTEEGCRLEHEVSPSTANSYETIPPTLAVPVPSS